MVCSKSFDQAEVLQRLSNNMPFCENRFQLSLASRTKVINFEILERFSSLIRSDEIEGRTFPASHLLDIGVLVREGLSGDCISRNFR